MYLHDLIDVGTYICSTKPSPTPMLPLTQILPAEKHQMGGRPMLQPLPTDALSHLDPFLLLHHHGPNNFAPGATRLEVGPHPHRGIETVTIIVQGDIVHKDNAGHTSTIKAGGVQWMTAGSGVLHDEGTSAAFNQAGGTLEIMQLWLNLPAKHKFTQPAYFGWQANQIPTQTTDEGRAHLKLISGIWNSEQGAHKPLTDVHLAVVELSQGGILSEEIPAGVEVLFYTFLGRVKVQGQQVTKGSLAHFTTDGGTLTLEGVEADNRVLLGYGTAFKEPVIAHGPFVMNTEEEIRQAYEDFRRGRFGTWPTTT